MSRSLVRFFGILTFLLATMPAFAQGFQSHPYDPLAIRLDSFTVSAIVPLVDTLTQASTKGKQAETHTTVLLWRTNSGAIEYTIDHDAIRIDSMSDPTLDISVLDLFDSLACAAVKEGARRGYAIAGPPASPSEAMVHSVAYVQQTGVGAAARWFSCTPDAFAVRTVLCAMAQSYGETDESVASPTGPAQAPLGGCERTYQTVGHELVNLE